MPNERVLDMMKSHDLVTKTYFAIICLLSSLLAPLPAFAASALVSGQPIITFDQEHGLLPNQAEPLLSIYANGTAIAVFPAYMKKAGRHTYQLSTEELQTLKTLMSKAGIQQFDQQLVQDLIQDNAETGLPAPRLSYVSDSTVTVVNINIDQGTADTLNTGDGEILEPLSQAISFENVTDTARNHPDIQPLTDLQRLEAALQAILEKTGR